MEDTALSTVGNAFDYIVNEQSQDHPHARMGELDMKNELVRKCFRKYPVLDELLPSLQVLRHYLFYKITFQPTYSGHFAHIKYGEELPEEPGPLLAYRKQCVASVKEALAEVERRIGPQYVHLDEQAFRAMKGTIRVGYVNTLCADIWLTKAQRLIAGADEDAL